MTTQVEQIGPGMEEENPNTNGAAEPEETTEETPETSPVVEKALAAEQAGHTPVFVSREDRQSAEIVNLKMRLAASHVREAQMGFKEAIEAQTKAQQAMQAEQVRLEQIYGINLTTHTIRDQDGLVIPRGPVLPG